MIQGIAILNYEGNGVDQGDDDGDGAGDGDDGDGEASSHSKEER